VQRGLWGEIEWSVREIERHVGEEVLFMNPVRVVIVTTMIAAAVVAWLVWRSLASRRAVPQAPAGQPPVANVFADLRVKYFTLTRNEAFPKPAGSQEPWGVMMEIGYPQQVVVTTVVFADGTASVLRSSGGGFFGGGTIESIKTAAEDFLRQARRLRPQTTPTRDYPQPVPGHVVFYLLTDTGHFTSSAREEELGKQNHPFSPLYYAGLRILMEYLDLQKQQPK
jgi:hypothetical protein